MILKLFQGDVVTKIRIETGKATSTVTNSLTSNAITERAAAIVGKAEHPSTMITRRKRLPVARLNESQVREIRNNWEATVKACGTKNAAAEQLSKVYQCSAKNIYAIIYRYSWANI